MSCWIHLGIEPTRDLQAIRLAYRNLLPRHHPETDPQGFQALREAYEAALQQARSDTPEQAANAPAATAEASRAAFSALLDDSRRRFDPRSWQHFIDGLEALPVEQLSMLSTELLAQVLAAGPLAHACLRLLAQRLGWAEQLLRLEFELAREADQLLQRIEQDDPFDTSLLNEWPPSAQLETLWYCRTLQYLYENRPLFEFREFVQHHSCLPLPADERFLQRLLVQFSQAGIGCETLHLICRERHASAPQDLDWRYLLARQSSALGHEALAYEHWLALWREARHPQAAGWLLKWCAQRQPQRLPLLIQAFDLADAPTHWPQDLEDPTPEYGSPSQRPETLVRWQQAAHRELGPLADAFVRWRLDGDELPLLPWLLTNDSDSLVPLYQQAWILHRGDIALLQQLLDRPAPADPLDALIVEAFQAQARQHLRWLQQSPLLPVLQAFLASRAAEPQLPPRLAEAGVVRDMALRWLERLRPYTADQLQRLESAFALEQRSGPLRTTYLQARLAAAGRTLEPSVPGQTAWDWQRHTLLTLTLLDQPERCLEVLPADYWDRLQLPPDHPLHALQQLLRATQGSSTGLLAWLDDRDPLQNLLAQCLLDPAQALEAERLLGNERLFACYRGHRQALADDPIGEMLLCAVLYHDPALSDEQRGIVLRTLSSFTSEDAWFAPFRDGLLRGRASRPPGTVLQDLGCTAENCQAVLDTLAGLVKDESLGVPHTKVLRILQRAKDDPANGLGVRLTMSALLAWCERLLLRRAEAKAVAPWAFWRLGSRLGRGQFLLQTLVVLLGSGYLLLELRQWVPAAILLFGGTASLCLRRLHDMGQGAPMLLLWLALTFMAPFAPLALAIMPGEPLPNRFGMPPGSTDRQGLAAGLQAVLRRLNGWRPTAAVRPAPH